MPAYDGAQRERLTHLLAACWADYDRLQAHAFIVRPAIPVLFFGDSNRYFASTLKVVTVGLNPSGMEFPGGSRFQRFPAASQMAADPQARDFGAHLDALNAYFRVDPYGWFGCYEPVLRGLDASFYDGSANTALHTDLCSPLATAPTWSRLDRRYRALLEPDGVRIWHALVEVLAPDIVLASVRRDYRARIRFPELIPTANIFTLSANRSRPYHVRGIWIHITPSKPTLLVCGDAAQTPFGKVSKSDKLKMALAIKESYDAYPG